MEVNKRMTKKHNLDFKKTIPYFADHIRIGKTLSKKIVDNIDFQEGIFFTILPSNAELTRLYEFSYGGIINPIPYKNESHKVKGFQEDFHPQQVLTMDSECSEFIANYLKQSNNNFVIIENYLCEIDDPFAKIEKVNITPFKNEVYYCLDKSNSLEEIYKTVRISTEVWHSLIVLIQVRDMKLGELKNEDLNQIVKHAEFIITGAYDGEGYIFWKKNLITK